MSFFSVERLTAGYDKAPVLRELSFDLPQGSLMGVLGANGSGKTTLLKAICGIVPHTGQCLLEGKPLECLRAKDIARLVSYIPQRSGITIDISALDVVLMGFNPRLGLLERPSPAMIQQAQQALETVGLSSQGEKNYLHLSEGQKQLCILARTLVSGSRLLLLDEPESALDFHHRFEMLALLRRRVEQENISAIVTLHDPALALNYCHRLLLVEHGRVAGVLEPERDSLPAMEEKLGRLYGAVSLQRCQTSGGKSWLVMLKEERE